MRIRRAPSGSRENRKHRHVSLPGNGKPGRARPNPRPLVVSYGASGREWFAPSAIIRRGDIAGALIRASHDIPQLAGRVGWLLIIREGHSPNPFPRPERESD